jgi:hypothetical protein
VLLVALPLLAEQLDGLKVEPDTPNLMCFGRLLSRLV